MIYQYLNERKLTVSIMTRQQTSSRPTFTTVSGIKTNHFILGAKTGDTLISYIRFMGIFSQKFRVQPKI